jgi:type IV pilus assembly protein PilQ
MHPDQWSAGKNLLQTGAALNLIGQFFVKKNFMLSPPKLATILNATVAGALLLLGLTACQHPTPPPPKPAPIVTYSETYDKEIKEIMDLAAQHRWEEAQGRANALYAQDPSNQILARVHTWVDQEAQALRAQALEDKIRSIDAKNSAFNPTVKGLLTEQKDRGLPPRKDVRDAVDRIENTPYIPDTYGKTVHEEGPLFDFESEKGRMAKVLEKQVSIHLDNVPLETILVNLSQSSGVNIVADKSLAPLKQVLSINLDNVKLSEFLRYVGRNYELQFQVGDELVWVVDAKDPKRLMEETRFYRLRKGFVLPAEFGAPETQKTTTTAANVQTTTEVQKFQKFVNDEAPILPSIERAITNLFTGSKAFIDYEHNLIVARGTPEQLGVIENIIKEFDKPIQQVLIEARFITVSKPAFMQLGVLWEADRQSQSVGVQNTSVPQDFTGLLNNQNFPNSINASPGAIISGVNPALGIGIQHAFTGVFGTKNLSATISALEQNGESQTLSAPRLTVLNNRPATISDGNVQYYYEEYSVASTVGQYYTVSSWVPSGKPTKITAGAVLNVLASISGDGKSILLALNPIVNTDVQLVKYATLSQYGGGTNVQSSFDIKLPTYRTEELSTRVAVKSGQTVVMGGVLQRERSTFVESVPVLGDIPIIGALFRRRTEADTPRYLLIFVTATIVKDNGEFLVYDETAASTNSVATPR